MPTLKKQNRRRHWGSSVMNVPVLVVDGVKSFLQKQTAPSLLAVRMPRFTRRISRPKLAFALPFIMTAASVEMRRESEVCPGRNNMAWLWRPSRLTAPASATPQTCSNAGSSVVSTDLRPSVA